MATREIRTGDTGRAISKLHRSPRRQERRDRMPFPGPIGLVILLEFEPRRIEHLGGGFVGGDTVLSRFGSFRKGALLRSVK